MSVDPSVSNKFYMQYQASFTCDSISLCYVDAMFRCLCHVFVLMKCLGIDAMFGCKVQVVMQCLGGDTMFEC